MNINLNIFSNELLNEYHNKYYNLFNVMPIADFIDIEILKKVFMQPIQEIISQIDISLLYKVLVSNRLSLDPDLLYKVLKLCKLHVVNKNIVTCFADYIERPLHLYVQQYLRRNNTAQQSSRHKQNSSYNNVSFKKILEKLAEKGYITENGMKSLKKIYKVRCKRAHGAPLTFEDLTELLEELANLNGTELEKRIRDEFRKCLCNSDSPLYASLCLGL